MKKHILLTLLFTFIVGSLLAQTDSCACCTDFHKQFDFWVGDWIVYDTLGVKIGENTIEKLENNCILSEYWRGEKGGSGRSYNYFNTNDSTWNQVWISSQGQPLVLKGRATLTQMSMRSELVQGKNGMYYNKICWSKNTDGSVRQQWEIWNEADQLLQVVFVGIYKKKT